MRQGLAFAQGLHRGVAVVQGEAVVAIGLELQGAQCSFHRLRRHARAIGSLGVVAQHIAADRQLATILTHTVAVIRGGRDVIGDCNDNRPRGRRTLGIGRHNAERRLQTIAIQGAIQIHSVGTIRIDTDRKNGHCTYRARQRQAIRRDTPYQRRAPRGQRGLVCHILKHHAPSRAGKIDVQIASDQSGGLTSLTARDSIRIQRVIGIKVAFIQRVGIRSHDGGRDNGGINNGARGHRCSGQRRGLIGGIKPCAGQGRIPRSGDSDKTTISATTSTTTARSRRTAGRSRFKLGGINPL